MKTYIVYYELHQNNGIVSGKMRVKNCMSEFHAKVKLEDYFKHKKSDFLKLVVHKVTNDIPDVFQSFFG
jgi:hypothetical protein